MTHLCTPPMSSMPPSRRSKNVSRYQDIAGLRDLAIVAQIEPAACKDPLQLLLVNLRLDKDAAADEAIAVIDQLAQLGGHSGCLLDSGAARHPQSGAGIDGQDRPGNA